MSKKEKLFQNKRVTVMGLGLHGGGVGVAKFFCEQGAEVLVTDLKTKDQLEKSLKKLKKFNIRYTLGEHKEKDFIDTDLVIKNPAVPPTSIYLGVARRNNILIETDINLFFKLCKAPIIGVTGTKGKSTVATIIYEILKRKNKNVILAGNIGVSPLEFLGKINNYTKVILELSSFELDDIEKSPQISVVTAIYPDHLDRYDSYDKYIESKKIIFKYQKPNDFLILNYENPQTRDLARSAKSKVYFFSNDYYLRREGERCGCFIEDGKVLFGKEIEPVFNIKDFRLFGANNILNLMAAVTVAKILNIHNNIIKKVVLKFGGVVNRQQLITQKRGVKYINDTTATMPDAVIHALRTIKEEFPQAGIILIAGGQDKKLEYRDLASEIVAKVKKLVLLSGTASEKIKKELLSVKSVIEIVPVESMQEAVKIASINTKNGDIVLLSPAAASFNIFKNEFDRGDQFVKAVKRLK